ncbi:hypothetical protein CR513_41812, partial [Mucuna pruriens]
MLQKKLQARSRIDNRNNVRYLAIVEGQADILPGELLGDLEGELAVNGLAVHIEYGVSSGVVKQKQHEESGSEDDLDDEGTVLPGPAIEADDEDGGAPEEEGEEEEGGGGEGFHSVDEGGASAEGLEAPGGLDDDDDRGEGPGDAKVEEGEEEGEDEEGGGEEGGEELDGAAEEAMEDAVGDGSDGAEGEEEKGDMPHRFRLVAAAIAAALSLSLSREGNKRDTRGLVACGMQFANDSPFR